MSSDPIRLEVFKHLFAAIAEEMGVVLRKASYSPNIKERRDFSCAIFNSTGKMISQAAHIPVHLGSMPLSVAAAAEKFRLDLNPGDCILLNDPYLGGTHLPDITLVTPVFVGSHTAPFAFVASRAHHADVGGMTPGSMPIAREIYQEGLIIPPVKLLQRGEINQAAWDLLLANVRTPQERSGDLQAQLAANLRGVQRFQELVDRYGSAEVTLRQQQLLAYSARMTRQLLKELPDGVFRYQDHLDDDGIDPSPIPIRVALTIQGDIAVVDFTGSAPQCKGSLNAVYAITLSAVQYVFRCLLGLDVPNNAGCLEPVQVIAPLGTVVNARKPAPVAGGNVETSQRIVDVLLGALAQACPGRIPAASQGTMNNLTLGGYDPQRQQPFAYYETIGGGMGASPQGNGASAVHSHMTNTLNTPIEAIEYTYPLRVRRYAIRQGSGGEGKYRGGDGLIREIEMLAETQVTLLSERRLIPPYGLHGGNPGLPGANRLVRSGEELTLPSKGTFDLQPGDVLVIETPGGGGWGEAENMPAGLAGDMCNPKININPNNESKDPSNPD